MSDVMSQAGGTFGRSPRVAIARHFWWWYFPLALGPSIAAAESKSVDWRSYAHVGAYAVFAAMLVVWAEDGVRDGERHRVARLAVFSATLVAYLLVASTWAGSGFHWLTVPAAVVVAAALASISSPSPEMRELAAPLLRLRAPRVAYGFAVLPWLMIAVLVALVWRSQGSAGGFSDNSTVDNLRQIYHQAAFELLYTIPVVIAWYGFAARRLLQHVSPLLMALIIGPLVWLATVSVSFWTHVAHAEAIDLLMRALLPVTATSVVAVWVFQRSRGSLVPVTVLLVVAGVARAATFLWAPTGLFGLIYGADWLTIWLTCLVALLLVVWGRMWRAGPQE